MHRTQHLNAPSALPPAARVACGVPCVATPAGSVARCRGSGGRRAVARLVGLSSLVLLAVMPSLAGCGTDEGACAYRYPGGSYGCQDTSEEFCADIWCRYGTEWCAFYSGTCSSIGHSGSLTKDWSPPSHPAPDWDQGSSSGTTSGGSGGGVQCRTNPYGSDCPYPYECIGGRCVPPGTTGGDDQGSSGSATGCEAAWRCEAAPQNASFCMQACAYREAGGSSEADQICNTLRSLAGDSASGCCPTCGL